MTHHTNKAGQPVNQQMLAALPFAILPDELKALNRFHECVTDGEGYDVPKEMMKRLAEIGLVRRVTANIYEHTNFGLSVLNSDFDIAAAEAAPPVVHDGYAQGVEAVAKMLEKKADDFASENGYDDMGGLSFGGNLNGELMRDYHSGLLELAEEVRAMKTNCQQPASAQPVAVPDGKQNIGTKPVNGSYFLCQCDKCGWLGSSEETRVSINHGYGDGDYYCPVCGTIEPEEVVSASTAFNAMLPAAQKGGAA